MLGAPCRLPQPLRLAHNLHETDKHMLAACRPAAPGPMIEADGQHFSARWGYLSRAGVNDKSQLMRQIEKYAGALGGWAGAEPQ